MSLVSSSSSCTALDASSSPSAPHAVQYPRDGAKARDPQLMQSITRSFGLRESQSLAILSVVGLVSGDNSFASVSRYSPSGSGPSVQGSYVSSDTTFTPNSFCDR